MRRSSTFVLSALLALCAACGEPEPAALRFKTQPAMGYALERLSPLEVEVLDKGGNLITGSNALVTLSLDAKGYPSQLVGTLSVPANNGVARFEDLFIDKEGIDFELVASVEGAEPARSNRFSVAPVSNPPTGVAFRSALIDIGAGKTLPAFEVAIVTSAGVPYTRSDAPVTLALSGSSGALSGTLTVKANRGVARFTDLSVSQPGTGVVLTATAPGLPEGKSQPFDVLPAGAPRLAFRTQPSFTKVNVPFSPVVEVAVVDAAGNVLAGERRNVTVDFGNNLYNAQLTGTRTVETANGVATFPGLAVDRSLIDATLIARSPGAEGIESTKFSVAP